MSDSVIVISSSQIKKDELIAFLRTVGADIVDEPGTPFFAYLSRKDLYIWVTIDNGIFQELEGGEPEQLEVIRQKLGDEPQSFIVLEISRDIGNKLFAYELAAKLAAKWPCITDNMNGYNRQMLSSQELFDLIASNCNFEEY